MADEDSNKSFTDKRVSVDLILMIILVSVGLMLWFISSINTRVVILQEVVGELQDHDKEDQKLIQELFNNVTIGD